MQIGSRPSLRLMSVRAATLVLMAGHAIGQNQPAAGMLRYPDVSASHVVFSYANDLWLACREGGEARPLASPAGQEMFPRFSPDGERIVFQGNYDGDRDLYVVGINGGAPFRVTHHPSNEVPTDWDADHGIVFHMNGTSGQGSAAADLHGAAGGRAADAVAGGVRRER
jgi:tricorn protease